jgi:hypothetical protein
MKIRAFAVTPRMQETAARALALVRKHRLASEKLDEAILVGVCDGMNISAGDAIAMYEFFDNAGYMETGTAPHLKADDMEAIVANLYGGTNGIQWCARVVRQIRKDAEK